MNSIKVAFCLVQMSNGDVTFPFCLWNSRLEPRRNQFNLAIWYSRVRDILRLESRWRISAKNPVPNDEIFYSYYPKDDSEIRWHSKEFLTDNGWVEHELFNNPDFKLFMDAIVLEMKNLTRKGVLVYNKVSGVSYATWRNNVSERCAGRWRPKNVTLYLSVFVWKVLCLTKWWRAQERHIETGKIERDETEQTKMQYRSD